MSEAGRGPTAENLLRSFPVYLATDDRQTALSKLTAAGLAERGEEVQRAILYQNIDTLPEQVLDMLAYDFKVDWWDKDYTIEEKRETLKGSWQVHRSMGTKGAVEKAISAIYEGAKVKEWFEYGGKPYCFKIELEIDEEAETVAGKRKKVLDRANYYKPVRAHLDGIEYIDAGGGATTVAMAGAACEIFQEQAEAVRY
jgi:phage tail P2-like protein